MTRSDLGVITIVYAVCVLFLYLTLQLKPAAQIYPLCLIAGLAILDTLYLFRCLWRMRSSRDNEIGVKNDLGEIFKNFQGMQFFFIVAACIAYIIALYYLGFYLSSFLYMIIVMLFLRVKPLQIVITTGLLGALVYAVFTVFLKVPLPAGFIFS